MKSPDEATTLESTPSPKQFLAGFSDRIPELVLVVVLVIAALLRFGGLDWDEGTHLHPDERFLTMVETGIKLPTSFASYFDTETSEFNPHNVGYGFFVYGTLPIFIVRYVGEWIGKTGYGEIHLVGRAVSATFDLISIVLIYFIGKQLFRRRVGLLAAVFVSFSVLLIQHAHFFVVESVANTFVLAGFYFAIRVLDAGRLTDYLLFGLALGMSVASKINLAPLAGLVAIAGLARVWQADPEDRRNELYKTTALILAAALVSLAAFRVFQPYAFSGPSFFNVGLNPKWLANMKEIFELNRGNTDAPYALQWADRTPVLFAFTNMLLWGMGLPLGIVAWLGWAWAVIEISRGRWQRHLLSVVWIGAYFLWQSTGFTPAMRYQMPVYPILALTAAWGLWHAWDRAALVRMEWRKSAQGLVALIGAVAVIGTILWAFAFTRIYREPLTRVAASRWIYSHIPGVANLVIEADGEELLETVPISQDFRLEVAEPYAASFKSYQTGLAKKLLLPYVGRAGTGNQPISLAFQLLTDPNAESALATAEFHGRLQAAGETRLEISLDQPVTVSAGETYFLRMELKEGGALILRGSAIIHETTWDDGMPWSVDGRDMNGRYESLNQELYWADDQDDDDNEVSDKLERITSTLSDGDYLIISSNRQYGSITRVPIRYPLTREYYRALFGCPTGTDILYCARVAQPGEIESETGYELIKVFQHNPKLGPIEVNDQAAEETFTVYDHPKVFIFQKREDFSPQQIAQLLEKVDLSGVQLVLPKDVSSIEVPSDLMLPADRWQAQQQSGTWSDIYHLNSLINRSGIVAVVVWWLLIGVLGIVAFPLTRVAFPGMRDGGYPMARVVGLLVVAWGSWMFGSLGVPVTAPTILLVFILLALVGFALTWRDRVELMAFVRQHRREILWTEAIALGFFLLDLIIRLGNPDLWHPAFGGEKPMDFSYLNAVLKSSTFPPYDPWFAGGYINYYYFGFVIVGMPIKLLGLAPAIAYNLVIPTIFSLLAIVSYSVAYNLVAHRQEKNALGRLPNPRLAGIAAAVAVVVLGNLGTARMFFDGFKQIGMTEESEPGNAIVSLLHASNGFFRYITMEEQLPYSLHQWYWNPSRSITPGEGEPGPITEFPFFTFIYADLHAHMINRPLTVLSIGWGLSWLLHAENRKKTRLLDKALGLIVGGLALGALRPTNTWDFPVNWVLGGAAVVYAAWLRHKKLTFWSVAEAGLSVVALIGLAQYLYQPYHQWYGLGYTAPELWKGSRTPLVDYLTVHGLYLFLIVSWMVWETRQWMAATPLTALSKIKSAFGFIAVSVLLFISFIGLLVGLGYVVAVVAFPLMAWCAILLLRPGLRLEKQVILILAAISIGLTFLVEFVVLKGDIGRMNTVFKFYLQVWEMFSLISAAAMAWVLADLPMWPQGWRRGWSLVLGLLAFSAALYPLAAAPAKMRDRMAPEAPITLDSIAFMPYAGRSELGERFSLMYDYEAIRWMQDNVEGTPVIVEANIPEYRWGSRFTIYTGLPGVLGWNNHQRQQRVSARPGVVEERSREITNFYLARSTQEAMEFLNRYQVKYVILGQLERIYYENVKPCQPAEGGETVTCDMRGYPVAMSSPDVPASDCEPLDSDAGDGGLICPTHGLEKFVSMVESGQLKEAFRAGETAIYEVVR